MTCSNCHLKRRDRVMMTIEVFERPLRACFIRVL
jgi:hypothetical protein